MTSILGVFGKLAHFLTGFRKKKTTIEVLEGLEKEIKAYEKYKQASEYNEKKYVGALLLYSIVLYILGAIFYFIYLMPKNLGDRVKTLVPFFIMPLIIFLIRKFLKWFYIKRLAHYEKKLADLKDEKKTILEEVKEKETYKKAREILDRFSPGVDIEITPPASPLLSQTMYKSTPNNNNNNNRMDQSISNMRMNNTTLVHRNIKQIQQQNMTMPSQPRQPNNLDITSRASQGNLLNLSTASNVQMSTASNVGATPAAANVAPPSVSQQRTLLPRPIIAPNRTILDKILDFLIGEGPNNRYALICKSCHFHNGMALREEFEFVAFRCAYCLFYNESRKTKLVVPQSHKLDSIADSNQNMNESNTSTSNLSSAASFDGESAEQGTMSEPAISAATMQKKYKASLNSQSSASQKSLENLDFNDERAVRMRKGSLGDLSNHLGNNSGRRGSNVETVSSRLARPVEEKENNSDGNDVEMEEFEHVDVSSKKYE